MSSDKDQGVPINLPDTLEDAERFQRIFVIPVVAAVRAEMQNQMAPLAGLAPYRSGRGTLKFPLGKRLPMALVKQFVRLRLKEELARLAGSSEQARRSSGTGTRTARRGSR